MNGSVSGVYMCALCILSALTAFFIVSGVSRYIRREKLAVKRRLSRFSDAPRGEEKPVHEDIKRRKKRKSGGLIFSQTVASELQTAGIMVRPEEFAIIWLILAFVPSGLAALTTGNTVISLALALTGIILPPSYIKKKKKKRIAAFEAQLSEALVTMCNCLRSGLTLNQAYETISTEMGEPISKEFSRLVTEIKYGAPIEKAQIAMAERIGSEDLMLAVSAINIQRQVGGNLSEILQSISDTIKARIKLKGDIKVLTASGRTSGMIIGFLPICLACLIYLLNPGYITVLFETPVGRALLITAAVMESIGFLLVKKIITIKY